MRAPERGRAELSSKRLRKWELKPTKYGEQLFQDLFASPNVLRLFDEARAVAEQAKRPLRIRLYIYPDANELHELRWETLYDGRPKRGWLLTNEQVRFSRFLSGADWEPANPRAETTLRALVAIANPTDLEGGAFSANGRKLHALDVDAERARAKASLGDLYVLENTLASDKQLPGQVTLERLQEKLNDGFDVVYLACHGALSGAGVPESVLLLEHADGTGAIVKGAVLVEQVRMMAPDRRPRLVVLASCQSAGALDGGDATTADADGALAALGPGLAQAGIPAVLAMQGSVSMTTAGRFVEVFFQELRKEGQADWAMAVARRGVAGREDSWMPVLYLRLRSENLWYTPSFGNQENDHIWTRLLDGIEDEGKCTPILGPGLSEYLFGPPLHIARIWSLKAGYPFTEQGSNDILQVAQYVGSEGRARPGKWLLEHYRERVQQYFASDVPADLDGPTPEEVVAQQIAAIARLRLARVPDDAYGVLARLPFRVYVNTNPDNLLHQALIEAGKQPVVEYARWTPELQNRTKYPSDYDQARDKRYAPSVARPLLYQLFGRLSVRESLILTEDNFFDYLMWVNLPTPQLPGPVGSALSENGLLFLGFGILDWSFRVVFRSLVNELHGKSGRLYKSVAVQVRPGANILNPDAARAHLERYFNDAQTGLYWGSVDEFARELHERARSRKLL